MPMKSEKPNAQEYARRDFKQGWPMNSARYGADPGSAWDTWYTDEYKLVESFAKEQGKKFPIINKLKDAHIVNLMPDYTEWHTGAIKIFELCDEYFSATLTKDEMLKLAKEIKQIAELL